MKPSILPAKKPRDIQKRLHSRGRHPRGKIMGCVAEAMNIKSNKGISLTEMMVSLGIFGFITAGLYATLYVGNTSWAVQSTSINIQSQARRSIEKMTRDLRVAHSLVIDDTDPDDITVTFTRAGQNIAYAWTANAGADQYRLRRTDDAGTVVVAQAITGLTFTETANDVKVNVTAADQTDQGQSVSYALIGNIALR